LPSWNLWKSACALPKITWVTASGLRRPPTVSPKREGEPAAGGLREAIKSFLWKEGQGPEFPALPPGPPPNPPKGPARRAQGSTFRPKSLRFLGVRWGGRAGVRDLCPFSPLFLLLFAVGRHAADVRAHAGLRTAPLGHGLAGAFNVALKPGNHLPALALPH